MAQRIPNLGELDAKARVVARKHLDSAVEDIDERFGAGTAAANPALVAGYIQTIAAEYLAGVTKWYVGDHVEGLHHVAVDIKSVLMDIAERMPMD